MYTATKIGMGLGLGIGIPLILLLGILLGMKIARRPRAPYTTVSRSSGQKISEMADNREPVELYVGGVFGTQVSSDRSSALRGVPSPSIS